MEEERYEIKNYFLSDEDKKLKVVMNASKICDFFLKQLQTDPTCSRAFSSSKEQLSWLQDCNNILDIGSGGGQTVKELINRGKKATGVTCNTVEKIICKQELNIDLVLADMHDMPFEDNSFDGIIMWDVLEHSISPYIAMHEACRVLKNNGKIIIYMPGEQWIQCSYHYSTLYPKQMLFLLARFGFVIDESTTINQITHEGIYKATKKEFNKEEFNKKYFK